MPELPKIARIASIVAFALAGITALTAIAAVIILLPAALIPLFAGIGIRRRRTWSAYGFAAYMLGQVLLAPVILLRTGHLPVDAWQAAFALVMPLGLAALFILAGRAMASNGATPGRAWPWMAVTAMFSLPFLFVQAFSIPTGAMEYTILIGDRILVQVFPRRAPINGEMVAFIYPVDRQQTFVKRVVGVSGDRIRFSRKALYRNGSQVNEPQVIHKTEYMDSYRDDFPSSLSTNLPPLPPPAQEMLEKNVVNGEVVVPPGKYFVVGDNRDQSLDSRYWGFVDSGDIIGRPLMVYYSADQDTDALVKGTQFHFPPQIRWNRLFKLL